MVALIVASNNANPTRVHQLYRPAGVCVCVCVWFPRRTVYMVKLPVTNFYVYINEGISHVYGSCLITFPQRVDSLVNKKLEDARNCLPRMCVYIYTHMCIYIHIRVCMYVCICMHTYMCPSVTVSSLQ